MVAGSGALSPWSRRSRSGSEAVIVVFRDGVAGPGLGDRPDWPRTTGSRPDHVYRHALRGFSATLPAQARQALLHNPHVAYIAPDSVAVAGRHPDRRHLGARQDRPAVTDPRRSSTTTRPPASGVTAYVIDTGIRLTHTEFGGRASTGFNFLHDGIDECNGHGTHVAGTIGGETYGVAKDVTLVSVRVFPCIGETPDSVIIEGHRLDGR